MATTEKPVPVVPGPSGASFALDHHHVATALWRAGIETMPAVLVANVSRLSYQDFWLSMDDHRWTYPHDSM
ncbi:ParB/Srx family N-terminal domain-containing protein [Paraburkholderia largidicola]|uniref:ParB/Srx family N-terminal domain-containing protein n=1 Tax=Paraburkholderia TaxID=1822464 RepID=UPI0015DA852E